MTRATVQATWDDVPHLSPEQKQRQWDSALPHEREARAKGVPSLGAGKIYTTPEEDLLVDPFEIPDYWPRAYGFDADWNNTAAIWGAWDRESDTVYLYSEYFAQQAQPATNVAAINARGDWIIGAMDPATNGKINPKDGSRLSDEYRKLGLNLVDADNAVEAGIFACHQRMVSGGLKVFRGVLPNWLREYRTYRRAERTNELRTKVEIVKKNDHCMDATRYLVMTGMVHARTAPHEQEERERQLADYTRDSITGY